MRRFSITAILAIWCWTEVSAQTQVISGPLTYERALELATSRNLGLAAARRSRAIREAAIRTAREWPNPGVAFETSREDPAQELFFELPVEVGRKRERRIALAREELTLADVEVQVEARTVRLALRQTFYELLASEESIRIAEGMLDISRRFRDIAQARFDAGDVPRLDVLQADLEVVRAETDLDLARSTRVVAQAELNGVLDLPPQQQLTLAGALRDGTAPITYERAIALANSSNVDLIGLDREIAVEERRVALLRAERTPTPVIVGGALFNDEAFRVGPAMGVALELPLFARNKGAIAESTATTAQLRAMREATRREMENSVFAAVADVDAIRRQVDAFERRLLPTAMSLMTLAEHSYRAGKSSILAVLEAQRTLRDLSREALEAALNLQEALAELESSVGTAIR